MSTYPPFLTVPLNYFPTFIIVSLNAHFLHIFWSCDTKWFVDLILLQVNRNLNYFSKHITAHTNTVVTLNTLTHLVHSLQGFMQLFPTFLQGFVHLLLRFSPRLCTAFIKVFFKALFGFYQGFHQGFVQFFQGFLQRFAISLRFSSMASTIQLFINNVH